MSDGVAVKGFDIDDEEALRRGGVRAAVPSKSKGSPIKGIAIIKKSESKDPCLKLNIVFDKGRSSMIHQSHL